MKILESAENYLETILILQQRNGNVRAVEIAAELDFSKPSVSVAMKQLRENGYIEVDGNGHITLLPPDVYKRQAIIWRMTSRCFEYFIPALSLNNNYYYFCFYYIKNSAQVKRFFQIFWEKEGKKGEGGKAKGGTVHLQKRKAGKGKNGEDKKAPLLRAKARQGAKWNSYKVVCRYSCIMEGGTMLPPVAQAICVAFSAKWANGVSRMRRGPAKAAQAEGSSRMPS